jgi:hypothetical protein
MPGIEQDDFVQISLVVLLIACQEYVAPQIWEHLANTMHKNVWVLISIVCMHMFQYLSMNESEKLIAIRFLC